MSAKYYTQFILTDADYRGGNEFCGVVELNQPMAQDSDRRDIEAILARNFDRLIKSLMGQITKVDRHDGSFWAESSHGSIG